MTYQVRHLSESGDGYIVVTLDDGSTFGQNIRGLMVQSIEELDAYVADLVDDMLSRESIASMKVPAAVVAAGRTPRPVPTRLVAREDQR